MSVQTLLSKFLYSKEFENFVNSDLPLRVRKEETVNKTEEKDEQK